MSPITHIFFEFHFLSHLMPLLPSELTVLHAQANLSAEANLQAALPAQIIVAGGGLYDGNILDSLPNLRLIARNGIGLDNIDLNAATERGIVVSYIPDGPTESTAEHAIAMLMAIAKRLKQGDGMMAAGQWGSHLAPELVGSEVQGKTIGLLGLGRIGKRVARICHFGLEMKVIAYDPYIQPADAAAIGVTLTDMDTVISQADFLSVHVPSIPETYRLINRARFAQMKQGSYLINVARGPIVDEEALLEALASGKIAGAGLDVFDSEPLPVTSQLRNHPRVIVTPHIASATNESVERMQRMNLDRILTFVRGERPLDVANPAVWENRRR